MIRLSWWHYGLWGLFTLLGATIVGMPAKIAAYFFRYPGTEIDWYLLPLFLLAIAGMGFACGIVVWAVLPLFRSLGAFGDACVGMFVMLFFFVLCMLIFDRKLLLDPVRAAPMYGLGIVAGLILGVWCGRDIRKWIAKLERQQQEQSELVAETTVTSDPDPGSQDRKGKGN